MRAMFYSATMFNQPLNNWNVSNVKTMEHMFSLAKNFNQPLNNWDVSNVKTMENMFSGAKNLNQPLNNWNVSNVTNMSSMFNLDVNFNQPLNNWDVSNVKDMGYMFSHATNFNQPLNDWDVSNVTEMEYMFEATNFNQPLNKWNVSNVTNMEGMFSVAKKFNQPLNNWNVSNVTQMNSMFSGATDFNQPLNNWNLSSISTRDNNMSRYIEDMFEGTPMLSRREFYPAIVSPTNTNQATSNLSETTFLSSSSSIINIKTDQGMDMISGEEVSVNDYLKEDINNVVFYFKGKVSSLISKEQLKQFTTDPSYLGSSIKYGCKQIDTSIIPRKSNLELDEPYFSMKTIGSYGLVKLSQINTIIQDETIRCIEISSEPTKNLVSTASYQMVYYNNPNAIGASHCQEGQNENVYELSKINIELTGGKERIIKFSKNTQKYNKIVKTRKIRKSKKSRKLRKTRKTRKTRKSKK
jgi:surface protein